MEPKILEIHRRGGPTIAVFDSGGKLRTQPQFKRTGDVSALVFFSTTTQQPLLALDVIPELDNLGWVELAPDKTFLYFVVKTPFYLEDGQSAINLTGRVTLKGSPPQAWLHLGFDDADNSAVPLIKNASLASRPDDLVPSAKIVISGSLRKLGERLDLTEIHEGDSFIELTKGSYDDGSSQEVAVALLAVRRNLRRFDKTNGFPFQLDLIPPLREGGQIEQRPPRWTATRPHDKTREWRLALAVDGANVANVWNHRVEAPYLAGLTTVRAGTRISLVPRMPERGAGDWEVLWSFSLNADSLGRNPFGGDPGSGIQPTILCLRPVAGQKASVVLSFRGFLTHEGEPLTLTGDLGQTQHPEQPGIRFSVTTGPQGPESEFIASVDLQSDPGYADEKARLPVPRVSVGASLPVAAIDPGGQDDLPGEELSPDPASGVRAGAANDPDDADASAYRRETPLTISLPLAGASHRRVRLGALDLDLGGDGSAASEPFTLEVSETNATDSFGARSRIDPTSEHTSQTVAMTLKVNPDDPANLGTKAPNPRVVVIDRDPFLVAEVEFPPPWQPDPATGALQVANWINGGVEGASWQIQTDAKPFDLILPPQSLGESMVKYDMVGEDQGAIDFRFSPLARQTLLASYFAQRYVEPPWNLRRILGYPGQRSPGAGVKRLQYELLYGLSCSVDYPFLRLAEIFSMIGQIQGRLGRDLPWAPTNPDQSATYAQYRLAWARVYHRYLSRLAVLEPWDSHQPGDLVLTEGVSCILRNGDQVYRPSDPVGIKDPTKPEFPQQNPKGLKGGATWGFESVASYVATVRDTKSSSARLVNPFFSALGGWGFQKASFNKDLSSIYSTTAMGRTSSYTVERKGRIGVFWNLAKHVIVYERSVVPSRQFPGQGTPAGLPVVRKVREYVEILEPTRNYPEDGTAPISRGFVAASDFKTKVMNVDSRWGRDLGLDGWIVPLWNPAVAPKADAPKADAAKADVYPKPQVLLQVIGDQGGAPVTVGVELEEPEKLVFYTNSRADADADPNRWPAVEEIDFVDLPPPGWTVVGGKLTQPSDANAAAFQGTELKQTAPQEAEFHPGYRLFTFSVAPMPRPANLVAQRAGQAVGAEIRNVTMVRAVLKAAGQAGAAIVTSPQPSPTAITAQLNVAVEVTGDVLARLIANLPARAEDLVQGGKKALQDQIKEALDGLVKATQLTETLSHLDSVKTTLETLVADVSQRALAGFKKYNDALNKFLDDAQAALSQQVKDITSWDQQARDAVTAKIKGIFERRTSALDAKAEALLDLVKAANDTAAALLAQIAGLPELLPPDKAKLPAKDPKNAIEELIAKLPSSATDPRRLQVAAELLAALDRLDARISTILSSLQTAIASRAEAWMPPPAVLVGQLIQSYHAKFQALRRRVQATVEVVDRDGNLPALTANDAQTLQDKFREIVDQLKKYQPFNPQPPIALDSPIDAAVGQLEKDLLATVATAAQQELLQRLAGLKSFRLPDKIGNDIAAKSQDIAQEIDRRVKQATDDLKDLYANQLSAPVVSDLREARQQLEELRDRIRIGTSGYVDAIAHHLPPAAGAVYQTGGSTLRLVRAFGKPPQVPSLDFALPNLAYFFHYDNTKLPVDMTPVLAAVDQAKNLVKDPLKALGAVIPTRQLLDRLVPAALENFKLSDVFPSFAGLKLSNLFANLKLPAAAKDGIKVSHGADPQTQRAWLEATIDVPIDEPATIFSFGPVTLRLVKSRFQATTHIEASTSGPGVRKMTGTITGDWELQVGGLSLITLVATTLHFDDTGHLRFEIRADRIRLADALAFVSKMLETVSDPGTGLSFRLLPGGAQATLDLPVPDLQLGAFGISSLRVGTYFALTVLDAECPGFCITTGFFLARREAPFSLTVFILGGGGYVDVRAKYGPLNQFLSVSVNAAITASASLAIALGPIRGGVYVYFGVTARFESGSSALELGILVLIRGQVSILGIVSAVISLSLEGRYAGGALIAHGHLSISIKICWCFTLEVNEDLEYRLGGGSASGRYGDGFPRLASLSSDAAYEALLAAEDAQDTFLREAQNYVNMFETTRGPV